MPGPGTGSWKASMRSRRCSKAIRRPGRSATASRRPSPTAAWCRRSTTRAGSAWTWRATRPSSPSNRPAWNCRRSATPRPTGSPTRRSRPDAGPSDRLHAGRGGAKPTAAGPSARAEHVGVGVVLAAAAFGQAELEVQPFARVGRAQRGFALDPAFFVEAEQALVEALDAVLERFLHRLLDLVHLPAPQQVADHRRV